MVANEPEIFLRALLRTRLTDPNPSRVASTPYIIDDWPYQTDLTTNHFPRVSVISQFENDKPWGIGSTDFWGTYRLQLDVWCKPDQPLTISSVSYEGVKQAIKITRDVEEEIRAHWITDLAQTGQLIVLQSFNSYPAKMEYDYVLWRKTSDITFSNVRT